MGGKAIEDEILQGPEYMGVRLRDEVGEILTERNVKDYDVESSPIVTNAAVRHCCTPPL